jgi:hypothetical protein
MALRRVRACVQDRLAASYFLATIIAEQAPAQAREGGPFKPLPRFATLVARNAP